MRLLSFGGGVQTTALAVLLVRGEVAPVDHIVMSDTGGETPETYAHVEVMADYLKAHGLYLNVVAHPGETLEKWTLTRSTPIPIRTVDSFGQRQCTHNWKIEPVNRFAKLNGAKHLDLLLGISLDEIYRMKPDQAKWITRHFPLIDLGLTRQDCLRIVAEAGLPEPPKSACFFCPLQGADRWRWLNAEHPDLFARAEQLEVAINARAKKPTFLTSRLVPIRELITAGGMLPGFETEECEGVCFV